MSNSVTTLLNINFSNNCMQHEMMKLFLILKVHVLTAHYPSRGPLCLCYIHIHKRTMKNI